MQMDKLTCTTHLLDYSDGKRHLHLYLCRGSICRWIKSSAQLIGKTCRWMKSSALVYMLCLSLCKCIQSSVLVHVLFKTL